MQATKGKQWSRAEQGTSIVLGAEKSSELRSGWRVLSMGGMICIVF